MKLSISNIGWDAPEDESVYKLMGEYGFSGLEIAPTRIFPQNPYDMLDEAKSWAVNLKNEYGFAVPSMQSIWYGRSENIFNSDSEREKLLLYTKKAIDFASVIECGNLVFGCPKNRNIPHGADENVAYDFFRELGDYAALKGTVIGMEANPAIYNTNFLNDTKSALEFIGKVGSDGFKLNLDIGTMIQNNEEVGELIGSEELINHVHISEPGLKVIMERKLHNEIRDILLNAKYDGFVSIEMGKADSNMDMIEKTLAYVREIFG